MYAAIVKAVINSRDEEFSSMAGWMRYSSRGMVYWHNGGPCGFGSYMALMPVRQQVVELSCHYAGWKISKKRAMSCCCRNKKSG